jgi:hypothetical protein
MRRRCQPEASERAKSAPLGQTRRHRRGVDNLFGVILFEGNKRARLGHLRTDSILRPLAPCP